MKHLNVILLTIVMLITSTITFAQQPDENFQTFWKSYTTNPAFQKERTIFPLPYIYNDFDDGEENSDATETIHYIHAKDWNYDDFHNNSGSQIEIQQKNGIYIVYRIGINNGIWEEYHFNLYDGRWYLSKFYNYSD